MDLLIDSNSYLRIARNIHPLLGQSLGPLEYKLFIHSKFHSEFNKNDRLVSKFNWVNTPEFVANRNSFQIEIEFYQRRKITNTYSIIKDYKKKSKSTISDVDMIALSTAYVLKIPLITDDPDMLTAADEFRIICIKTIEFLSYLHKNKILDDFKVSEIFGYWEYDNDCPTGYKSDRTKYFPHLK